MEVYNLFIGNREDDDRWGPAKPRHQELPALYFVRSVVFPDTFWQRPAHEIPLSDWRSGARTRTIRKAISHQ